MSDDLERLRSIGQIGKTRGKTRVREIREDRAQAFEIDYPDGRVEAVVRPATVRAQQSLTQGRIKVSDD